MKTFKKWMVVPYEDKIESSEENDLKRLKEILNNNNLNDSQKYNNFNTVFKNFSNKKGTNSEKEKKETTELPPELPKEFTTELDESIITQPANDLSYTTPINLNRTILPIHYNKDSETEDLIKELQNNLEVLNESLTRPVAHGTRDRLEKKMLQNEKKQMEKEIANLMNSKKKTKKRKNENTPESKEKKKSKKRNDDYVKVLKAKKKNENANETLESLWETTSKNKSINSMVID